MLESRLAPDTKTFAGLDFSAAAFSVNGSQVSASGPVTVAVAHENTALLRLAGGVSYDEADTTGSFTPLGSVSAIVPNQSDLPLLNGSTHAALKGADLLGSGATIAAAETTGVTVPVASEALTVGSIHIAGAANAHVLALGGSVALAQVDGLSIPLPQQVFVQVDSGGAHIGTAFSTPLPNTSFSKGGVTFSSSSFMAGYTTVNDVFTLSGSATASFKSKESLGVTLGGSSSQGLVITDGSLTSLDMTVNASFQVAGVTFTPNQLNFNFSAANGSAFDMTGGATVALKSGETFAVNFGDNTTTPATPGVVVTNGDLTRLDMALTTTPFTVAGVTITPAALRFTYANANGNTTFDISGGATVTLKSNESFSVNFGDSSANPATPGLVVSNGTLTNLDMTLTATPFTVAGVTITPSALHFTYANANGNTTFNMSGGATVALKSGENFGVTFGPDGSQGLVVSNGSLQSLDMAVTSNITIGSATIRFDALEFMYTSSPQQFAMAGSASLQFSIAGHTQTIAVALGTHANPGLVVTGGSLTNLNATVTADFDILKLHVGVQQLNVAYDGNSGNFTLDGSVTVSITGSDKSFANLSATFGGTDSTGTHRHGIDIQHGDLQSLFIIVNGGFSLYGLTLSATGVTVDYDSNAHRLGLAGGVSVELTDKFKFAAKIAPGSLFIDTNTGALSLGSSFDLEGSLAFGPVGADVHVKYLTGPGSSYSLNVKADLHLPEDIEVGGELGLKNGNLTDIAISFDGSIEVGTTGVFITHLDGGLHHLDDPSHITIEGGMSLAFGPKIAGHSIAEATGHFLIDPNHLHIDASVSLIGGLLGEGDGFIDINWTTGVYDIHVDHIGLYDDTFNFSGDLTFDNFGNITLDATADVRVPKDVPVIGGLQLVSLEFYLQVRPNLSDDHTFGAAWTTTFFGTIGFQIDLNKHVKILTGAPDRDPAGGPQSDNGSGQHVYFFEIPVDPKTQVDKYMVSVDCAKFNDPNLDWNDDTNAPQFIAGSYVQVFPEDANHQPNANGGVTHCSVNGLGGAASDADKIVVHEAGRDATKPNVRIAGLKSSQFGDLSTLKFIRVEVVTINDLSAAPPMFSYTTQFAPPQVTLTSVQDRTTPFNISDVNIKATVTLTHSDLNAQGQPSDPLDFSKARVSLYYQNSSLVDPNHANPALPRNGRVFATFRIEHESDGSYFWVVDSSSPTQIVGFVGSFDPTTRTGTISYDWNGLPGAAPDPFFDINPRTTFIYADVSDGLLPTQYSVYSSALADPDPHTTIVSPSSIAAAPQGTGFAPIEFGDLADPSKSVFKLAQDPLAVQGVTTRSFTVTVLVDRGGTLTSTLDPLLTYTAGKDAPIVLDATSLADAQEALDALIFTPDASYSGLATITVRTDTPVLGGRTYVATRSAEIVAPNARPEVFITAVSSRTPRDDDPVDVTVVLDNINISANALPAANTRVAIDVPQDLTLVSAQTELGTFDPLTKSWNVGDLPVGQQSDTFSLTLHTIFHQGLAETARVTATAVTDTLVIHPEKSSASVRFIFDDATSLQLDPTPLFPVQARSFSPVFSQEIRVDPNHPGAGGPYVFTVTAGALPSGMSLSRDGILAGLAQQSGFYDFTVAGTDRLGNSATQTYTLMVVDGASGSYGVQQLHDLVDPDTNLSSASSTFKIDTQKDLNIDPDLEHTERFSGWSIRPDADGRFASLEPNWLGFTTDVNGISDGIIRLIPGQAILPGFYAFRVEHDLIFRTPDDTIQKVQKFTPVHLLVQDTTALTAPSLPFPTFLVADATVGQPFSETLAVDTSKLLSPAPGPLQFHTTLVIPGATHERLPPGLSLDPATGVISGTPREAGKFKVRIGAFDSNGNERTLDTSNVINVAAGAVTFNSATPPAGSIDNTYVAHLSALGGASGILTYSVTGGTLPPGLTFNQPAFTTGTVTGVSGPQNITAASNASPIAITSANHGLKKGDVVTVSGVAGNTAANGTFTVTVLDSNTFSLNDSAGNGDYTRGGSFVGGGRPIVVTSPQHGLHSGDLVTISGIEDSLDFNIAAASAANGTFTITVIDADHFSLNGTTPNVQYTSGGTWTSGTASTAPDALITGTPRTAGTSTITVTATDKFNPANTAAQDFTITVNPTLALVTDQFPSVLVGTAYPSTTLAATGGSGTGYTFRVTQGFLPPGLTLSSAGVLSGIPAAAGSFDFAVTVSDSAGATADQDFELRVTSVPGLIVGAPAAQNIAVTGETNVSQVTGALPPGVTLGTDGTLNGTPTAPGTFAFGVEAVNSGQHIFRPAFLQVAAAAPPTANADTASTAPETAVTIDVLGNDTDPNNLPLTLQSVGNPTNGMAQVVNNKIRYTPGAAFTGTDNFTYVVANSGGASATASVQVVVARAQQTIRVSTLDDGNANPNLLSLRQAIATANGDNNDTIVIPAGLGSTYTLVGGELSIQASMSIQGPGAAALSIVGNGSRLLHITGGIVTLSGLTLTQGTTIGFDLGAAILVESAATLSVDRSVFDGNVGSHKGGGIYNDGTLTVTSSTFRNNQAGIAGALSNHGTATVVNSTFLGNTAADKGGAIFNEGTLTLVNDTITRNSANSDNQGGGVEKGGGIEASSGAITNLLNTIVAGNFTDNNTVPDDVDGALAGTSSFNLIGVDANGNLGIANGSQGNLVGAAGSPIDARLGVLGNNGGPTPTISLLAGSPVVGAGSPTGNPTPPVDQRGQARASTPDIGAFETQVALFAPLPSPASMNAGQQQTIAINFGSVPAGIVPTATSDHQALFPNAGLGIDNNGNLTLHPTGSGTANITVTITDPASHDTESTSFAVTVFALPLAVTDTASTPAGTAASIDVLANDNDPNTNAGPLTIQSVANGAHGTTTIVNGKVTYMPAAGFAGSDTFKYVVLSSEGGTTEGTVNVTVQGQVATVTPAVANADSASTPAGKAVTIDVLGNDTGLSLTLKSVTAPIHGTAQIVNNKILYTPAAGFSGGDSFSYIVANSGGATATATVHVDVAPPARSTPPAVTLTLSAPRTASASGPVVSFRGLTVAKAPANTIASVVINATTGKLLIKVNVKGLKVTGQNTGRLTLSGTQAALNRALQALTLKLRKPHTKASVIVMTTAAGQRKTATIRVNGRSTSHK